MLDLTEERLVPVVRRSTGRPDAELGPWRSQAADHLVENLTTASLVHVRGTLADGTAWGLFAKELQPASASPVFAFIPPELHEAVLRELDWRAEPRTYRSGLADDLPPDLRLPTCWQVDEDAGQIVLWLEEVADAGSWDLHRYRRAGRALGRLAGRWPEARAVEHLGLARRDLAFLFFGKISQNDLPLLADDATWAAPHVAEAVDPDLRGDLARLAGVVPELLARMEVVPHAVAHGDASPGNLLAPADGPLVAIDWSYGAIGAVGSDLAQLVAGRFEDGTAAADEVASIAEAAFDGYLAGAADEGVDAAPADVRLAWATHLVVRSAFSAVLVGQPGQLRAPDVELVRRRAALARFAVELARDVLS